MKNKICLSRKSDNWATPKFIYRQAINKYMCDPCPLYACFDGLSIDWGRSNFVNPPYSQLLKWIKKSIEQHQKGKYVLLLIPARTDTKAFKLLYEYGSKITFITGRLHFNEKDAAPFPSMLVELTGTGRTRCRLVDKEKIKI